MSAERNFHAEALMLMAMVDSGRTWLVPGLPGVDGDAAVIKVMDAAEVIVAALHRLAAAAFVEGSGDQRMTPTLFIIEGCDPSHRFAEMMGGLFGDRAPRVCVGCLVQETDSIAEDPCPRPFAAGVVGDGVGPVETKPAIGQDRRR